jgi:hypothetical protein
LDKIVGNGAQGKFLRGAPELRDESVILLVPIGSIMRLDQRKSASGEKLFIC